MPVLSFTRRQGGGNSKDDSEGDGGGDRKVIPRKDEWRVVDWRGKAAR